MALGIVYGGLCLSDCPPTVVCPNARNTDTIRIVMLIIGAGLVFLNLHFVTKRIQKTDIQIEKTEQQFFLQSLHQGIGMLYSNDYNQSMGGFVYLDRLAQTCNNHKQINNREQIKKLDEQIKKILHMFCEFVTKGTDNQESDSTDNQESDSSRSYSVKASILHKITNKEEVYGPYRQEVKLKGAFLQNIDLRKINLKGINLEGANLFKTDLRGADLRSTQGIRWQSTQDIQQRRTQDIQQKKWYGTLLNYAIFKINDQELTRGQSEEGREDIIWLNPKNDHLFWKGKEVMAEKLIELLEEESEKVTDPEIKDIISHVINPTITLMLRNEDLIYA